MIISNVIVHDGLCFCLLKKSYGLLIQQSNTITCCKYLSILMESHNEDGFETIIFENYDVVLLVFFIYNTLLMKLVYFLVDLLSLLKTRFQVLILFPSMHIVLNLQSSHADMTSVYSFSVMFILNIYA